MARDLDHDAERLALVCMLLLRYAEAKSAWDHAKDKTEDLKAWQGSEVMGAVEDNVFEMRLRLLHDRHRASSAYAEGCRICEREQE